MSDSNSNLDIQRLSALSDGIFAVAMTLLAFSIHLPESSAAGRLANDWSGGILAGERGAIVKAKAVDRYVLN
jgi:uncharacterized membrane protein